MLNNKIPTLLTIFILAVAGFFLYKTVSKPSLKPKQDLSQEPPKIVSTKPDPLDDNIVSANDTIEITFNLPIQNIGEFKSRLDPNIEYKVELSGDRKTAKIKPIKPLQLGTTYTLFIGTETKFDGVGRWGQEKIYHFRTIKYTGV